MDKYIINSNVLCFTQDLDKEDEVLIIEKYNRNNINGDCFKILKNSCKFYGHSYKIQRQIVIDLFNYYIKTPIILSEFNMIIFFPTASPNSKNCIWISYNNVDRYVKEDNYTKIYFKGGKILNVSVPYNIIDNQITKCIKIEKYLNKLNIRNEI